MVKEEIQSAADDRFHFGHCEMIIIHAEPFFLAAYMAS